MKINLEEATTGFLGFTSFSDFSSSLLGVKTWVVNTILAAIGIITTFISNYLWDDPNAVWLLWALMGADWATGIAKSVKNKRFVSYKFWRMPLYFVATSAVLAFSWWMSKTYSVFYPLPSIAMCGFYSVYFVSILENLGEIGLLPKAFVRVLKTRFGFKKLIDKL